MRRLWGGGLRVLLLLSVGLPAGAGSGAIVEHVVPPRSTDPAISRALEDHVAMLDPAIAPERDLFVFLPGTGVSPRLYRRILREAAASGFHGIGLMYANEQAILNLCNLSPDVDCAGKVRQEIVAGEDTSPLIAVSRVDSIESRLARLLAFLDQTYPTEGWGRWLVAGQPDYRRIRFSGHSQGGAHAAFIARSRDVAGVSAYSSPQDWDYLLDRPATWVGASHVTPSSRYYGFSHLRDGTALWSLLDVVWNALGMGAFGPRALVDASQPPYGGSHQLVSDFPLPATNGASFHTMPVFDDHTPLASDGTPVYAPVWRAASFWKAAPAATWILPSAARVSGAGGAFYTTSLSVANTGGSDATFSLTFLGHDSDGRFGPERSFALAAGASVTYADILGSVFGLTSGYGAVRVTSESSSLAILSQTSTPSASGGTFGQSLPCVAAAELLRAGVSRSIAAVREDVAFRTNLILVNATEAALEVEVGLVADTGTVLAGRRVALPPLGMTQISQVVRELGVPSDVSGARLVLTSPTAGGAFAAYASVIDNVTNDPRTLLPR